MKKGLKIYFYYIVMTEENKMKAEEERKERRRESAQRYREAHREELRDYMRKARIERTVCECGTKMSVDWYEHGHKNEPSHKAKMYQINARRKEAEKEEKRRIKEEKKQKKEAEKEEKRRMREEKKK
jgi:hypothetical protein